MRLKTLPIFLAFFVMGVADAISPLSEGVKNEYGFDNVARMLMPFVVFIAFAVFSVPGGLLAARIGKKNLLLLGLGLNSIALLIPSLYLPSYPVLLGCIFVLGIGTTLLQVAGNPIMRDVSDGGGFSRNLSFAQGFKGIGSTVSTYLPNVVGGVAFLAAMKWRGVFPLYCGFMVICFFGVLALKIKETKVDVPPSIGSSLALLSKPAFAMAVLGIFLYVGSEVCMTGFLQPALVSLSDPQFRNVTVKPEDMDKNKNLIALTKYDPKTGNDEKLKDSALIQNYLKAEKKAKTFGPAIFLLLLTFGRILGGLALTVISPRAFFRISAFLGLLGGIALMTDSETAARFGVIAAGLGYANIWPLLFSITVEEKPECSNELSGLMCMAISGGAIVPLLMGKFWDMHFGVMAFIVPSVCFAYLLLLSLKGKHTPANA